jgi:signal transduction histidine kinase
MQPLRTLRHQISAVRQGSSSRLTPAGLKELDPVVEQINELLEAQEAAIAFARERAADLAHGLKTPLAVLSATAERFRQTDERADADLLQMLTDQMNARIDYQLKIARLRFRTRAQGAAASLNEAVLRSVAVLRKSPQGEHLNWLVDLNEQLKVDMDEHDLMELVGIILENATQWASRGIEVTCLRQEGQAELIVQDDGVGLNEEDIAKLGARGVRLDQSSQGDGIGLAIAHEVVRLNRGRISITAAEAGGLRVSTCLPLHT